MTDKKVVKKKIFVPVGVDPFKKLQKRFGLVRTSGDKDKKGVHSTGSYHYKKAPWGGVHAYDYGDSVNTRRKLVATGTYLAAMAKTRKGYRGKPIREVFGPFPFYVKDNKVYRGRFPGHGDHLHVALGE